MLGQAHFTRAVDLLEELSKLPNHTSIRCKCSVPSPLYECLRYRKRSALSIKTRFQEPQQKVIRNRIPRDPQFAIADPSLTYDTKDKSAPGPRRELNMPCLHPQYQLVYTHSISLPACYTFALTLAMISLRGPSHSSRSCWAFSSRRWCSFCRR